MRKTLIPALLVLTVIASGCIGANQGQENNKVLISGVNSEDPTVLYPGDSITFERSGLDMGCVAKNFNSFWTKNWDDNVEVGFTSTWSEKEVEYTYSPRVENRIEYASHRIFFNSSKAIQRCSSKSQQTRQSDFKKQYEGNTTLNTTWANYSVDEKAETYQVKDVKPIHNWDEVLSVERSYIYGKKAKVEFNVLNYSGGPKVRDCSLQPTSLKFLPSNENHELETKRIEINNIKLCRGDQITLTHEASNLNIHPKGIMQIRFMYKEKTSLNPNITEVRLRTGKFNVMYGDNQ